MPALTYSISDYQPFTVIKSSEVVARFNDIKTLLNTTKIDDDNIQNAGITRATKLKLGTASHVVINDGTGAMSSEAQLAIARGGTGAATANTGFNALAPSTTKGDVIVRNSTVNDRLAVGTDGQVLTADAAQTLGVKWATPAGAPDSSMEVSNLSLAVSVSSNDLIIALKNKANSDPSAGDSVKVGFRNATATTGTYSQVLVTAALSLTVPNGATLGHTSAVNQYVWVYLINNAGTAELAVSGVKLFDEYSIASSTTISTGADSETTLYSATGRSNVPIRLIGRLLSNQATAGTYASAIAEVSLVSGKQPVTTTEWATFTPTGTWVTNTTWTGTKRRVGDTAEYRVIAQLTGDPGSSLAFTFNVPDGSIDTTKESGGRQNYGYAYLFDNSTSSNSRLAKVARTGTTAFELLGHGFGTVHSENPFTFASSDSVELNLSVPIVGWSLYGP